ncbi:MAG: enoyl-CoA hydratase [Nitrospirae bacterium]|nr:enoyl-CoA hydratase [Nitrospirota bacterium]
MDNQFVNVSVEEGVATLVLNNPPVNALSSPLLVEFEKEMEDLAGKASAKVIIIAGAGTMFVAGADIKEIAALKSAAQGKEAAARGQEVFNKIERSPKPVIAAIQGVCLGGGLELAMACHMRVISDRARLGQPEINLGIIPGFGGTQRLARWVGKAKAIELILTGEMITAQEAKAVGLVNRVVPEADLLRQTQGLAKKIAGKGQLAVRAALKAIQEGLQKNLSEGLALESELFGQLCETEDMKEGLTAFIEKRQPRFQDR